MSAIAMIPQTQSSATEVEKAPSQKVVRCTGERLLRTAYQTDSLSVQRHAPRRAQFVPRQFGTGCRQA